MEPDEAVDDEVISSTQADLVWKWTIRALYTTAIALNLWLMVAAAKDDPEAQIAINQFRSKVKSWTRPFTHRQWLKREANKVVWEAMTVVEGVE